VVERRHSTNVTKSLSSTRLVKNFAIMKRSTKEIQVHISFPFGKTLKLHSSCGELIDVSKFVGNNTAYVIVV
jgi:hypothetical protein